MKIGGKLRMRAPSVEGAASHDDSMSCQPVRKPRIAPLKTVVIAALVSLALPARADKPSPAALEQAKQHYKQADADEKVGAYDDAIREFSAAYEAAPLPAFLFNLAHCYRLKGDNQNALVYYEKFLALAPNTPPFSDQARQQVAHLKLLDETARAEEAKRQAEEARRQAEEASQRAEREARQRAEADAARQAAEAQARRVIAPRPESPSPVAAAVTTPPSPSQHRAGIALLAAGGAALVGGVTLLALATVGAGGVNDVSDLTNRDSRISTVQGERIGGGVALGVGAAALAAGVVLYLHSRQSDSRPGPPRRTLWLAPAGNGLQVGGVF